MIPIIDLRYGVDVLDGLRGLADQSVHMVCTSPPYFSLRSYLPTDHPDKGQELGNEKSPDCLGWATGHECGECFVCRLVAVFREIRRVLRDDGTAWLNLGDSYAGSSDGGYRPGAGRADGVVDERNQRNRNGAAAVPGIPAKNLMLIPARVALALQADGWIVRNDLIWHKLAPMPSSARDRFTVAHEDVFLLVKQARYYFDMQAVATKSAYPGGKICGPKNDASRNDGDRTGIVRGDGVTSQPRDVLSLSPESYGKAHFATFPTALARICILAGSSAAGCCAACGRPWVRVVEKGAIVDHPARRNRTDDAKQFHATDNEYGAGGSLGRMRETTSLGWRASCACNAAPIPCTVLDPFSGSGTTAAVAKQCGRSAIGLDLNAAYLPLAEDRIASVTAPMVPAGYEDNAPVASVNGYHETQQELFP